jgi:hypothetical protein
MQMRTTLFWLAMLVVTVLPALIAGLLVARPVGARPHRADAATSTQDTGAEEM